MSTHTCYLLLSLWSANTHKPLGRAPNPNNTGQGRHLAASAAGVSPPPLFACGADLSKSVNFSAFHSLSFQVVKKTTTQLRGVPGGRVRARWSGGVIFIRSWMTGHACPLHPTRPRPPWILLSRGARLLECGKWKCPEPQMFSANSTRFLRREDTSAVCVSTGEMLKNRNGIWVSNQMELPKRWRWGGEGS